MTELDKIAVQWRPWDDRSRASALGELFRVALLRVRGNGSVRAAPIAGAARALLIAGRASRDDDTRVYVLDRALQATRVEGRGVWTLQTLTDLAACHSPAFPEALAAARDRPKQVDPTTNLWARECVETLAKLVAIGPATMASQLFAEVFAAAAAVEYDAFKVPYLMAHASPGIGPIAPDELLARAAASHPYYRALCHALIAKDLPPDARRSAVAAALSDANDPSLGDARPFVALAPLLDAESYPRAIELASHLNSSLSFGATAMASLLPGWAAIGNRADALRRARTIAVPVERGIALGNIAALVDDASVRDDLVLEALSLFVEDDFNRGVADVAARLVPLGYGPVLLELPGRRPSTAALVAVATHASGDERSALVNRLSQRLEVRYLERFGNEIDPAAVFLSWFRALRAASATRSTEDFFEDEYGVGFSEWMAAVPLLGGPDGLRQVADAIMQ